MDSLDEKKQPIIIDSTNLTLIDRVRLQMKTLHDYLEQEMPLHGWFHNKSVCCFYDDMPTMFSKCSSLYAEYDDERSEKETRMFLLVSVLHPQYDICRCCYKMNGNKKELLAYLSNDTNAKDIANAITQLSTSMSEKDND